jgi:hypothetical protein
MLPGEQSVTTRSRVREDVSTRPGDLTIAETRTSGKRPSGTLVPRLLGSSDHWTQGSVGRWNLGTLGTVGPLNHTASSKSFGGGNSRRLSPLTCSLWKVETRTRAGSRFEVIFRSRTLHICRQLSAVELRQPVGPIHMGYRSLAQKPCLALTKPPQER